MPQPAHAQQGITILEPESMVLRTGVENAVRVKLEKVGANNTILKVVNEDACDMRKGSELDMYYLTPKSEGGDRDSAYRLHGLPWSLFQACRLGVHCCQ